MRQGLFSLIIVTYALVSEKAPNCRNAYNIWAILCLDLLMAILWLSSMGANAALRASFVVAVQVDCWDDGSAVNAGHCVPARRDTGLSTRDIVPVAGRNGLAEMSAVAGLSALEMYVFLLNSSTEPMWKRNADVGCCAGSFSLPHSSTTVALFSCTIKRRQLAVATSGRWK